MLPPLAARVKGVFTVSESAKADIATFYGLQSEHLYVVPNALDLEKWHPAKAADAPRQPYLLVVSANRHYKNTTELLQQHKLWLGRYRVKIVSTRARYGHVIRAAVRQLGLERSVDFLDGLSEHELIELYRGCSAVVYPSLMEGFGRPALEGMAVGRPVILSDIAVHQELFAGAAIFITSGNALSWELAFRELNNSVSLQARIEAGLTIARSYTLENGYKRLTSALLAVEPELEAFRRDASGARSLAP